MLVDPEKVLNDHGEPTDEFKAEFGLKKPKKAVMQFTLVFAKWRERATDEGGGAASRWVDGLEYGCLTPGLWGGPTGCKRQCIAS